MIVDFESILDESASDINAAASRREDAPKTSAGFAHIKTQDLK